MKIKLCLIVCVVQFAVAYTKVLNEDYLPEPCPKSEPDYNSCILKNLNKVGPYALKGIPKYNIPKMDPLEIPNWVVNRTINEFLSLNAALKGIKMNGLSKIYINELRTDVENLAGEIKLTIPYIYTTMEYDVKGILLGIPLESEGFFRGNFTEVTVHFKGNLKVVEKESQKHFALDKFKFKSRIGNGYLKLTAKRQQDQFAADLITSFFNNNPRQVLDATNPFYIDAATDFYRSIFEYILDQIPAGELLPE